MASSLASTQSDATLYCELTKAWRVSAGHIVAILVVNPMTSTQSLALPLADIPDLACGGGSSSTHKLCTVRDVWAHASANSLLSADGQHLTLSMGPTESLFYILAHYSTTGQDPSLEDYSLH